MSSRGKKKTTMAKLSRESRLRERRQEKKAKKDARRQAPAVDPYQAQDDSTAAPESDGTTLTPDQSVDGVDRGSAVG